MLLAGDSTIACEKRRANRLIPLFGPGLETGHSPIPRLLAPLPQRDMRGVMKGADHSREIDDGKMLAPAFGQWPGRFSLVIDNNEILACIENLAEVIISVAPDAHGG